MKKIKAVVGSNFGDEGKGLMTDYFCSEAVSNKESCVVVCSNGGAQRGHTVVTPSGIRHVFHHFGSGSLAGADTYLPEEFILNPMIFRKEWEELVALGCVPKVFVHPNCMWSTPWDMMTNQIIEDSRGNERHGSVGVGIWETIDRYNNCKNLISLSDFYKKSITDKIEYLGNITLYFAEKMRDGGLIEVLKEWYDVFMSKGLLINFIEDIKFMIEHVSIASTGILQSYDTIVFENGQGLLLDQSREEYGDNTTPSNTGILNVANIVRGLFWEADVEVCYVTRTYMTRHGAGRFDEECDYREINLSLYDKTNVPNPYQGALRYGKMNVEKLIKRIDGDFISLDSDCIDCCRWRKSIAVTHVNEYDGIDAEDLSWDFDRIYLSDSEDRNSVKMV